MTRSLAPTMLLALVAPVACAPKPSSAPAPGSAPAVAAALAIRRTCFDATDGPSVIVDAIENAHRALVATPTTPLPPACVVAAFAQMQTAVPDSTREHGLSIAAELGRRGPATPELLISELMLLSTLGRYADVSRAYDRLTTTDSAPPMDVVRLALAAARTRADTATLVRVIGKAAARPDAPVAMRTEQSVLRSVPALWTAINQAKGFVRQNPRNAAQYPSIVANFGTLALTDSVAAWVRRGLANGATRAALTPSTESLVTTMQRHASLYASTYGWEGAIAGVARVDSALSTPSTKFLMASLIVQSVGPGIDAAGVDVRDVARRADGCQRLVRASAMLDAAEAHLRGGGDRHTASAVSSLQDAMTSVRNRIASLRGTCAGDPTPGAARSGFGQG